MTNVIREMHGMAVAWKASQSLESQQNPEIPSKEWISEKASLFGLDKDRFKDLSDSQDTHSLLLYYPDHTAFDKLVLLNLEIKRNFGSACYPQISIVCL